jgi:methyl-accepting chemotaxis protein
LEELRGHKPGEKLQGPETDPRTVRRIRDALHEERPIRTTILNYTKSGRPYWVRLNITPYYDDQKRLLGFVGVQRVAGNEPLP